MNYSELHARISLPPRLLVGCWATHKLPRRVSASLNYNFMLASHQSLVML